MRLIHLFAIRRTNQGVIGAHEALPLVIGGDICAAPLYAAYHRGFFDDAGLNVTLAPPPPTPAPKDSDGTPMVVPFRSASF